METHTLFDTPLFVFRPVGREDLDDALVSRLVQEADQTEGLQRFNYGGWHSEDDLSLRTEPCFRNLMEMTHQAVREALTAVAVGRRVTVPENVVLETNAWSMVMRYGDYATLHDHAEAHFSTVYYPDAGESTAQSGGITFVDGRRGGARVPGISLDPTEFTLCPQSGMLLVFPGWLQHYVHPYLGECPRVSIASNVRISLDS